MSTDNLNKSQKDFICKKLAQFVPHRQIAQAMLKRFPDLKIDENELMTRIKYYASSNTAPKWRARIKMYRNILNSDLEDRFALANPFIRLRYLEKIITESLKPQIAYVVSYPDGRDKEGNVLHEHKEIYKTNPSAAIRAIITFNNEFKSLKDSEGSEYIRSPELDGLTQDELKKKYIDTMALYKECEASGIELED